MVDDKNNLEDQLNILFDDFDEDDAAPVKAGEVREAAEEKFNIPTLNLNELNDSTESSAFAAAPADEAPKAPVIPDEAEVKHVSFRAPEVDDSALETESRGLSFDDFEDLIPEDDEDEAPVAYQEGAQKKADSVNLDFEPIADEEEDEPVIVPAADTEEEADETPEDRRNARSQDKNRSTLKSANQTPAKNNEASRDELRKESIRFWIFTVIVALIVAAAVLFILNRRGIINLFGTETTAAPTEVTTSAEETTAENSTEELTTEAAETTAEETTADTSAEATEDTSAEETEDTSAEEAAESEAAGNAEGAASVVGNYANMFIVKDVVDDQKIDTLRVRASASTDAEVIGLLRPFEGGEIVEDQGEWLHVFTGGLDGYISSAFVMTGEEAAGVAPEHAVEGVKANGDQDINIRSAANTDGDPIDAVKPGTVMEFQGEEGDFYAVRYYGTDTGYISKDFSVYGYYLKEATKYYAEP